ncbi:hypothetical protein [Pararobbsia silviterrae]|nr:hypothetical protein [Pararobbsia silviterrae]
MQHRSVQIAMWRVAAVYAHASDALDTIRQAARQATDAKVLKHRRGLGDRIALEYRVTALPPRANPAASDPLCLTFERQGARSERNGVVSSHDVATRATTYWGVEVSDDGSRRELYCQAGSSRYSMPVVVDVRALTAEAHPGRAMREGKGVPAHDDLLREIALLDVCLNPVQPSAEGRSRSTRRSTGADCAETAAPPHAFRARIALRSRSSAS